MRILPLLTRELRIAARRRRTWWWRFVAAGVLALIAFLNLMGGGSLSLSTGESLFSTLSIALFILALFSGSIITAGAWAEENAEGTVDLLLLTRLRGADIVLGRLLGDGLFALTLVAAALPVFVMPLMAGGVDLATVLCVAATILATTILSILSAAFVAVTETDGIRAIWKTVLLQFAFGLGCLGWVPLWIAGLDRLGRLHEGPNRRGARGLTAVGVMLLVAPIAPAIGYAASTTDFGQQVVMIGPAATMVAAFDVTFQPGQYATCLSGLALMCLAMLYLTSLAVGKHSVAFRQRIEDSSSVPIDPRDAAIRHARRRSLDKRAGESPVAWLAAPGAVEQGISFFVCAGIGGILVIALWQLTLGDAVYLPVSIALRLSWFVLSIAAPMLAARFYVRSRSQGAFELLLVTPLRRTEFIRPLRRVWWRFFRLPLLVVGLGTVCGQFFFIRMMGGPVDSPFWTAAVGPSLMVALNCFELVASAWLAMWLALKLRTPRSAPFLAFLITGLGSYVITLLFGLFFLGFAGGGILVHWTITPVVMSLPGAVFPAVIFWAFRRQVRRFFGVANDGHPAADPSFLLSTR